MSKYVDLLKTMDIFQGLDEAFLARVSDLLKERRVQAGTMLFRQGDSGEAMYIVLSGRIKIFTHDATGAEKVLAFNTEGSFFGESALLTGEPRSASAEAATDSRLLVLSKPDFNRLLADNATVLRAMLQVVARRQAATNLRLVQEMAETEVGAVGQGQVYTVFSPKGGAGTSTIAVNLAVALAQMNPDRVVLLDLSLVFGHAALMLNLTPRFALAGLGEEAIRGMDRESLGAYLVAHSTTLRVLTGSLHPEDGETVTGEHVRACLDTLRRHFSYVVVDTSSTFTDPVLAAVESADRIILVATPEITTLRDIRECQRIFTDVIRVKRDRLYYVMNQTLPFRMLSRDQFEGALDQTMDLELPYGGDVPSKGVLKGESIVATQPGHPLSKAIERMARDLAGEKALASPGASASGRERKRGFLFGR